MGWNYSNLFKWSAKWHAWIHAEDCFPSFERYNYFHSAFWHRLLQGFWTCLFGQLNNLTFSKIPRMFIYHCLLALTCVTAPDNLGDGLYILFYETHLIIPEGCGFVKGVLSFGKKGRQDRIIFWKIVVRSELAEKLAEICFSIPTICPWWIRFCSENHFTRFSSALFHPCYDSFAKLAQQVNNLTRFTLELECFRQFISPDIFSNRNFPTFFLRSTGKGFHEGYQLNNK